LPVNVLQSFALFNGTVVEEINLARCRRPTGRQENGTSPTTYNPGDPVPREQMAAFVTRTLDQSLKRGNRRAAFQQWWTPRGLAATKSYLIGIGTLAGVVADGEDIWGAVSPPGYIFRVHAHNLVKAQVWSGADGATGIIAAAGYIFITGALGPNTPGKVYRIEPRIEDDVPGDVEVFESSIGTNPVDITFDGTYLWTANRGSLLVQGSGSISRIRIDNGLDETFTAGFSTPNDILWDGANLWVADQGANRLKRVDTESGAVLESIPVWECQEPDVRRHEYLGER
jgi:hypothetical protein